MRRVFFWTGFAVVMVPAASLTVVRLFEPGSARALQLQAFTPFALPLYAVALVMLTVSAVRVTRGRAHLVAPAVLVLLGLGAHGYWFSPQVLGSNPEPAADATPIQVMTANLLAGEADVATLVELVREDEVELLVVNEITDRALRDMRGVGMSRDLPYEAGTPGDSVEGTMLFSREPFDEVQPVDTEFGSWVATTRGLVVLAVHPEPPLDPDQWRADHEAVYSAAARFEPDLVMGDFNATPDHEPMRRLSESGYRDSVEVTNGLLQPTWPANGDYPVLGWFPPTAPIDHVLVGPKIVVVETTTHDLPASDHRAVTAEIARR